MTSLAINVWRVCAACLGSIPGAGRPDRQSATRSLCSPPATRERLSRSATGEPPCPIVREGGIVSGQLDPEAPVPETRTGVRSGAVVATLAELRAGWPDLRGTSVIGLDLRHEDLDWAAALIDRTIMLGCRLPTGVADSLVDAGAGFLRAPDGLPFDPFRMERRSCANAIPLLPP